MPKFRYTASDRQGVWRTGEAQGETREEVEATLAAGGLVVESIREAEADAVAIELAPVGGSLSRREVAELVEQLEGLTRAGLPLPSGLRAAGAELDSVRLRSVFLDLASRLEAGEGIDRALTSGSVRYPSFVRGLILAGGRSGRLAEVLAEYVRTANLGEELRRKFWGVVAYPLFAQSVMLILAMGICHLSAVMIDGGGTDLNMFGNSSNQPKLFSRSGPLMRFARFVDRDGPVALLLVAIAGVVGYLSTRWSLGPARFRRLLCSIPVLGPLLRFAALTEFCQLLAMLLEAVVPLPEALRLAGDGVRDADLADTCGRMGQLVAAGSPLSEALTAWPAIPAGLGQLFRWSETTHNLPGALRTAGDMFEARARSQAVFSGNVVAAFLTLLIFWWVGFALAVLYVPLLVTIRVLSG